jgi:hypothetical protein
VKRKMMRLARESNMHGRACELKLRLRLRSRLRPCEKGRLRDARVRNDDEVCASIQRGHCTDS